MPSEATLDLSTDLMDRALDALAGRISNFHETVAAAEREVSEEVARRVGEESFRGEQALIELGPFAVGRIDPDRFAQLLGVAEAPLTPEAIDVLGRADALLRGFTADPAAHVVEVERGGDLRDSVRAALAGFGRIFGAARAVELARAGTFDEAEHGHLLGELPFRLWNRAERHLAPPLLVRVRGEDCLPASLGEFLDGNMVLVLVVEGPATPAPLSRLVTPGTFVLQTADVEALNRVTATDHPAVALLFDEDRPEQAYFVHDPDLGNSSWERVVVDRMPSDEEVGRGRRAPRWVEDVEHLRSLAASPVVTRPPESGPRSTGETGTGATGEPSVSDNVDRLAAWLLSRTRLDGGKGS